MKFSGTVSTPAVAIGVGPSRSISWGVRRSSTSRSPNSSTSLRTSCEVAQCSAALRRSTPERVLPPSRSGRPPTSRTLSRPSKRIHRSITKSILPNPAGSPTVTSTRATRRTEQSDHPVGCAEESDRGTEPRRLRTSNPVAGRREQPEEPMTDPRTSLIRQQLAELGRRHAAAANAGAVSPRAPRVLVIGNFGNGNTGDEAMLARTLQELPEGREVKVVSRNPRMVEALHHVPAVPMEGVALDKALHCCDGIAVVGGGLFGTGASPLVKVLPAIVWATTTRGRDIAYVAIGVYPGTPDRVLDL